MRRLFHTSLLIVSLAVAAFAAQSPSTAREYFESGRARSRQGDLKGALADFNRAIELNSQVSFLYLERGALLPAKGEDAAAQQDFDQPIKLDPSFKPMVETRIKRVQEERESKQQ